MLMETDCSFKRRCKIERNWGRVKEKVIVCIWIFYVNSNKWKKVSVVLGKMLGFFLRWKIYWSFWALSPFLLGSGWGAKELW